MELTLYELSEATKNAIDGCYTIDEETGEILFCPDQLEELELAMRDKVEACTIVMKQADALADAIDSEIKALQSRKKAAQTKADHLKNYISMCMERAGVDKLETARFKASFRNSEYVDVINESQIPPIYKKTITNTTVDKVAIKKAIKSGGTVPGAGLFTRKNLQIK